VASSYGGRLIIDVLAKATRMAVVGEPIDLSRIL